MKNLTRIFLSAALSAIIATAADAKIKVVATLPDLASLASGSWR